MTIREYNLARQGHERQIENRTRAEAAWMAMILNSQYSGAEITSAQLLGEDLPPEKASKAELKKADRKLAKMLKAIAKRRGK
jgi:hypothetical protein